MNKVSLALALALMATPALAQRVPNPIPNAGVYGAYNAAPPTCVSGSGCWFQTDLNGNLKVAIASGGGSGGTASSFGAAFPATGTAIGFSDGTNMVAGRVTPYGTEPTGLNALAVNAFVTNTTALGQATMAASSPVVIASNQSSVPVVNGAADPCQTTANSGVTINIGTATTTRIITPSASNRTYICSVDLFAFAADNVAIVEGTGGTCGTGTAGVVGGTTTATGISFPAQGGLAKGGAGSWVWRTAGTNVDFCLITSTTGPLTGFVKYVQAP